MISLMKKQPLKFAALAIILAILFLWIFARSGEEGELDILTRPTRGPFQVTVTATGELQAKNSTKIYGPGNARTVRIWDLKISKLVPEGTVVKKGDFVAEIDKAEISNRLKDVQLEIQKAESKFTQAKLDTAISLSETRDKLINLEYGVEEAKLNKEQSTYEAPSTKRQAEIEYEKAVRNYQLAGKNYETKVRQAVTKVQLAYAELSQQLQRQENINKVFQGFTVKAPADGMVIYKKTWRGEKVTEGSNIGAWDPVVATLPDLSVMESVTYVNEVDIQKIKPEQRVEIGLDADPDKKLTGKVTEIANIGEQRPNSDSKVFEVKILVNESDSTLRPAMTTGNTIIVAELEDVLSIPLECIQTADSLTFVFKKSGFKTVKQEVQIGMVNENNAVILAGLFENDKIYLSTPKDANGMDVVPLTEEEKEHIAKDQ